jgi:hypothetical protein
MHGAQRLGCYDAASEFWPEQWEPMLGHVENGPVHWPWINGLPPTAETIAEQDDGDARLLMGKYVPDPLPCNPEGLRLEMCHMSPDAPSRRICRIFALDDTVAG